MDVNQVRRHFPVFEQLPDLIYLDSAATCLKPQAVLQAVNQYYSQPANVFRGIYQLSEQATQAYESARQTVAQFLGGEAKEIVWTHNTTAGINLVSYAWQNQIQPRDEILVTAMEHHANLIPWQQLAARRQAKLIIWPVTDQGTLDLEKLAQLISPRTKLLAVTHVSNVLGTINPVADICRQSKQLNPDIKVLVDGAQAVPHLQVDVNQLGCDWYVFSGHKLFGPTGTGVLWSHPEVQPEMQVVFTGGEMIKQVSFDRSTFLDYPYKFEPGTPHIAGVIGLAQAVTWLQNWSASDRHQYQKQLLEYAYQALSAIPQVKLVGPQNTALRAGVLAFVVDRVHPHDLAQWLDFHYQIAIRAGHHCAMPLHRQVLNLPATARLSLQFYNTTQEIDTLVAGIHSAIKHFSP